jgi:hypothetical protein
MDDILDSVANAEEFIELAFSCQEYKDDVNLDKNKR